VSTSIDTYIKAEGSIFGATKVYIKGSNFNTDPNKIDVRFGPYQCKIYHDGLSASTITCETAPATDPTKLSYLSVKVTCLGVTPVECGSSNCLFSYTKLKTPIIHELFPKSAAGGQQLHVFGIHRISNLGDGRSNGLGEVNYLLINSVSCSLLDIIQDDIDPSIRADIQCNLYRGQ
jgi:hypothetical protein